MTRNATAWLLTTVDDTAANETEMERSAGGLLIASNRLPMMLTRDEDGGWRRDPGSGGLVTALEPVLRDRGGVWVGWPGVLEGEIAEDELAEVLGRETDHSGYRVSPVPLTAEERGDFYLGFANEILWPLFHGLLGRCRFERRYWRVYRRVNRKFAEAIAGSAGPDDLVWVHDYHLMAVADELRELGIDNRLGFFLHIPFPAVDIFEQLPWAQEVLASLLRFDCVGFQTRRDRRNFVQCVEALAPEYVEVGNDVVEHGPSGRRVRVGVFPISIDLSAFHDGARTPEVEKAARELREDFDAERILLGVDRLDYTKGIPQKLLGFERALEKYPDLRGRVTMVQLVVPSRERIPEYNRMKEEIEGLVGRVNGRFTRRGWAPILYQFGSWGQKELLSFYRTAHVAVVTSLRDGMNLVSKEFVAASVEEGVLVLSSFAGSADELGAGALLVNPNDVEAVADAIHRACTMNAEEKAERLARMQEHLHLHDVHHWVEDFLEANREEAIPAQAGTSGITPLVGDGRVDPRAWIRVAGRPRGEAWSASLRPFRRAWEARTSSSTPAPLVPAPRDTSA